MSIVDRSERDPSGNIIGPPKVILVGDSISSTLAVSMALAGASIPFLAEPVRRFPPQFYPEHKRPEHKRHQGLKEKERRLRKGGAK